MSVKKDFKEKEKIKYCGYIDQIRQRLTTIQLFTRGNASLSELGREDYDAEFVALQLRKILELIAFSSLIANKKIYSKARKEFATDWNAKKILKYLEKVNPNFYPEPIYLANDNKNGVKHFEYLKDGYLTKKEFVFLYNKCGKALHALKPFSGSAVINFEKSIDGWVQKIIYFFQHIK